MQSKDWNILGWLECAPHGCNRIPRVSHRRRFEAAGRRPAMRGYPSVVLWKPLRMLLQT